MGLLYAILASRGLDGLTRPMRTSWSQIAGAGRLPSVRLLRHLEVLAILEILVLNVVELVGLGGHREGRR